MNKKKWLIQIVIALILLGLGIAGLNRLKASKPQIKRNKPVVTAPMVSTLLIKTQDRSVRIEGQGTVRPVREISLVPQVGGKVVFVAPALVNGGQFDNGDVLLRIDPVDYQLAVTLSKARVKDAESLLRQAEENTAAAKEEWRLLFQEGSAKDKEPPPLVAKEPQLAAAQARLEAERANLKQAQLNLARTELKAPFDGRVRQENVDVGQFVSPGQGLATLYATEAAEIVVPLADETLRWFHVPGFTPGKKPGARAEVRAYIAGRKMIWQGEVVRTEGQLDERTRMINVVVQVEKPYARKPPLALGLFVDVIIEGRTISDATMIPRAALRENHVVWVVDAGNRLRFRKVDVARIQGDDVLIQGGLKDGARVVVSPLKAVSDGMLIRTLPPEKEEGA